MDFRSKSGQVSADIPNYIGNADYPDATPSQADATPLIYIDKGERLPGMIIAAAQPAMPGRLKGL